MIVRYQRERPGELVHIDTKKLGRFIRPESERATGDRRQRAKGKAGWQYLFVAVNDATRLAYAELYPDETNASAISFLEACSSGSTRSTASASSASSPITAPASNEAGRTPATNTKSQPNGHDPTDPRQTARRNASSAPCWNAGHTPPPTQQSTTARKPSHRPSTPTIATDHTALDGRTPLQRVNDLSRTKQRRSLRLSRATWWLVMRPGGCRCRPGDVVELAHVGQIINRPT